MNLKWMNSVLSGEAQWSLADVRLSNGRGINCKGQGILRWSREQGTNVEAFTDGAKELINLFGATPCEPGQLFPADWYLRLDGATQTGEKIVIERIVPDGYTVAARDKPAYWSISPADICSPIDFIDESVSKTEGTLSEVVITPNHVRPWLRFSTISDDNHKFGGKENRRDWVLFEYSGGEVALRSHDQLVRARIRHKSDDPARAHFAVNLALSFAFGKLSRIDAVQLTTPDVRSGQLAFPTRTSSGAFPSPIGNVDSIDSEKLLSACTELFMDPECPYIAHVYACLETSANTLSSHAVVLCASLESMLSSLAGTVDESSALTDEQQVEILKALTDQKVSEAVAKRVQGILASLKNARVKDILRRWAAKQQLSVTEDDVAAWNKIRNLVAHGGLLALDNETVRARYRLQNLVNKCVLQAARYDGYYFDYVSWSPQAFPLADLAELRTRN